MYLVSSVIQCIFIVGNPIINDRKSYSDPQFFIFKSCPDHKTMMCGEMVGTDQTYASRSSVALPQPTNQEGWHSILHSDWPDAAMPNSFFVNLMFLTKLLFPFQNTCTVSFANNNCAHFYMFLLSQSRCPDISMSSWSPFNVHVMYPCFEIYAHCNLFLAT